MRVNRLAVLGVADSVAVVLFIGAGALFYAADSAG